MNSSDSSRMILVIAILMFVASLLFGGCASSKLPPSGEIAETRAAVQQAEQVGARNYAPLEFREASKKLEEAQKLVEAKKYKEARLLAEKAKVDAELAEIKTLSAKARKAVNELKESIRALQEEINRKQIEQ